jgi:hypothetical protein
VICENHGQRSGTAFDRLHLQDGRGAHPSGGAGDAAWAATELDVSP